MGLRKQPEETKKRHGRTKRSLASTLGIPVREEEFWDRKREREKKEKGRVGGTKNALLVAFVV